MNVPLLGRHALTERQAECLTIAAARSLSTMPKSQRDAASQALAKLQAALRAARTREKPWRYGDPLKT